MSILNIQERLEKNKKKQEALKLEQKKLLAQIKSNERKARTKELIERGAIFSKCYDVNSKLTDVQKLKLEILFKALAHKIYFTLSDEYDPLLSDKLPKDLKDFYKQELDKLQQQE